MLSIFIFNDSNSKHVKMTWKKYKQRSLCIDRINKQDNSNNNRIIFISSVTTNHVQTMLSSWNNVTSPYHSGNVILFINSFSITTMFFTFQVFNILTTSLTFRWQKLDMYNTLVNMFDPFYFLLSLSSRLYSLKI